jgi:DNA-directed RNA polymerase subunit RPC12/RpoP
MPKTVKLTQEFVEQFFKDQGCDLLDRYKNARTKMKYRCLCGHVSEIVFDSFRRGNRCRQCGSKKIAATLTKINTPIAKEYFASQGCELLDEYKRYAPMDYRCSCGKVSKINWNNFKSKGRRCHECGIKRRSGENHYEWRKDRDKFKLEYAFRHRSYKLLKLVLKYTKRYKTKNTAAMLGYTHKQLQDHITSHPNWIKVKDGAWHLDHIFPIKAFLDHDTMDVNIVNALDNLQPLAALDNMSKNATYDQESFRLYLSRKGLLPCITQ